MTSEIFGEKQEININKKNNYYENTIQSINNYLIFEHDSDALLKYIKGNRINHDVPASHSD